ncbi:MAG: hypothetical protein JWM41_2833 [Gemmatimonadetes bacterium]|nr:hypothetical protein [Gemmatimonadota bacterium]
MRLFRRFVPANHRLVPRVRAEDSAGLFTEPRRIFVENVTAA